MASITHTGQRKALEMNNASVDLERIASARLVRKDLDMVSDCVSRSMDT